MMAPCQQVFCVFNLNIWCADSMLCKCNRRFEIPRLYTVAVACDSGKPMHSNLQLWRFRFLRAINPIVDATFVLDFIYMNKQELALNHVTQQQNLVRVCTCKQVSVPDVIQLQHKQGLLVEFSSTAEHGFTRPDAPIPYPRAAQNHTWQFSPTFRYLRLWFSHVMCV